jgi:NTP pyrophosphatase (non-canonical NTP hydrolase)
MQIVDLVKGTASEEYLDFSSFEDAITEGHDNIHALLGAGIGMSGEVGEFNEILKKHIWQGKNFDETHAKKELGDIYWYFALACIALNVTPAEIEEIVSEKLAARYSGGRFNKEQSENRKVNDL